MNKQLNKLIVFAFFLVFLGACTTAEQTFIEVKSPSNNISVEFFLKSDGSPNYLVKYKDKLVIDTSALGFELKDQPALNDSFRIIRADKNSVNEQWELPWGEQRIVKNNYNEVVVKLKERKRKRTMSIYFKAYDDGIAFRYEIHEQKGVDSLIILNENTQFKLTEDPTCWWIPANWQSYEHLYNTTKFSEIDALSKKEGHGLGHSQIPYNAVHTPFTMRNADGLHLSFHEAALLNYASMTLKIDPKNLSMTSQLVGSERLGYAVKRALPFKTPWRSIQIAEKAKDLIASNLILNLNEPNKLGDVSYFKPMKYVGIWWEMHVGKSSWDMASKKHGATTKNAKYYIDFAAKNNIKGLLVEGWNTGWEVWGREDREGVFDFVTPYPDYDIKEVVRYAKEKGIEIIMHHETSAAPRTYEKQLDTAYKFMQSLDIHSVKTGYVGKIIPKGEFHHGQWMINHYQKVFETAANYKIAVDVHEPIKETGLRRTYPNAISREALRGQEFNAWAADGGNPPEHISIIAFTTMLGGPIDFTPGVFKFKVSDKNQINTTLAQQLALYVVIYSPIQMACDLPENYEGKPAFQFIRDVGVDWEQTKVLDGEVGDFVCIARQERETKNWFLGCVTDEESRYITINFDFLEKGKKYEAIIYSDAKDSQWKENPTAINIEKMEITSDMEKRFELAEGGGLAISLMLKK